MEYSGKHAAVLADDMLLEWDDGNVIIPRRVSGEDKFIFESLCQAHSTVNPFLNPLVWSENGMHKPC